MGGDPSSPLPDELAWGAGWNERVRGAIMSHGQLLRACIIVRVAGAQSKV